MPISIFQTHNLFFFISRKVVILRMFAQKVCDLYGVKTAKEWLATSMKGRVFHNEETGN